ncbi:MAG: MATE family efflux transporter [Eubacterium sp.]|nr:MATE family efflux transporter [Eubacterium sp.]
MQNSADKQYIKMTETPVNKLISRLAVPTVISMLIMVIYNIADTYFVSKISVSASGATGVVFSLMGMIQAIGFMFGQGAGSCISRRLGAKDIENARKYSATAFYLALFAGLIIALFGLIFMKGLMGMLGSTKTILPHAEAYGKYILIAAPAMTASYVLNNILRFEGMAKLAMVGIMTGSVLNIFLDPLFIFTLKMGTAGAGAATALSQYIGFFILISFFIKKKTQSRLSPKYFTFKVKYTYDIITVGLPSLARQGLNSISNMLLNLQGAPFGDECIAAMSITARVGMLIFSVCLGIGQGFQPVCSFNYGAEKYKRVDDAIRFVWRFGTFAIVILSSIAFIFAPGIVALFRSDNSVVEIGSSALRYLCIAMVFMPTVMTGNMTFQSIGKSGKALFLSSCQNGLFFVPLILLLPKFFGVTGIELSWPIAYTVSALVALPMILKFKNKLKQF